MLLSLRNLSLNIKNRRGDYQPILKNISFDMSSQEKIGIVGESGAGKSMITRAILRLVPEAARLASHSRIIFDNQDLYQKSQIIYKGHLSIATVLQDPHTSLNPAMRIKDQIREVFPPGMSRKAVREKVIQILETVCLQDPERLIDAYPCELSGGMAQRVMVGMMLAMEPKLFIADEPTSSLDAPVALAMMRFMMQRVEEKKAAFLLVSHDINMVKHFCDRILVMYNGEVVEDISVVNIDKAKHPYTKKLLEAHG